MSIQVKNIEKHFGAFHALNNISLDFPDGQLVALLGPSGCGKTTLLRIIAGLETADGGQVILEGEDATAVHVRERQVGFVFQHYALFRHMSVFENIAFGLRVRPRATRPSESDIKKRVMHLLDLVQLSALAERFPAQLSGGQRQRVWIAMVLAQETSIMLLDEPTTWLDISHQIDLLELLSELNRTQGYTLAAVLHDLNQACRYATHLIALRDGEIVAQGAPKEIVTPELIERIYGMRCMIIDDPVAGTPLVVPLGKRAG